MKNEEKFYIDRITDRNYNYFHFSWHVVAGSGQSQSESRQYQSTGNQKQHGLALLMYADDNRSFMPPTYANCGVNIGWWVADGHPSDRSKWRFRNDAYGSYIPYIYEYAGSDELFLCPAGGRSSDMTTNMQNDYPLSPVFTFAMKKVENVPSPSDIMLCLEGYTVPAMCAYMTEVRHDKAANILFADGYAETVGRRQLFNDWERFYPEEIAGINDYSYASQGAWQAYDRLPFLPGEVW